MRTIHERCAFIHDALPFDDAQAEVNPVEPAAAHADPPRLNAIPLAGVETR
jgi:hypothetical protein